MTNFLDELDERLARTEAYGVGHYYKPLGEAVDEFIRFAENPGARVKLGIPLLDDQIRGVAPGELCLINGFAHSGKTVLATEILLTNHNIPMMLVTPDETRPAVLAKLAAADTGVGAEELERRIYQGDAQAREILLGVAQKYHQLAVYDDNVTIHMMDGMFKEAESAFGEKPRAVLFDYAEQLNEATDTKGKIDMLKRWGKQNSIPLFVLHQASRSKGAGGQALGMDSGAYGGEQQATFMITVRRKIEHFRERLADLEQKYANSTNPTMQQRYEEQMYEVRAQIPHHKDTVSVGLVKNKRPPMNLVPERDFKIDNATGRVSLIYQDGGEFDTVPDAPLPGFVEASSGRNLLK